MATCISRVDGLSTDPQVWGVTIVMTEVEKNDKKIVAK